jgi:membrane-associated PAP2 superfamily phosphatase
MTAYTGGQDALTPNFSLSDLQAAAGEAAATAFRGRRATAATWAFGYALLALVIVLVPYRRGERWAWWALLISIGISQLLSLARALALHSTFGTATPGVILAFALLGLMAGAPRMFSKKGEEP